MTNIVIPPNSNSHLLQLSIHHKQSINPFLSQVYLHYFCGRRSKLWTAAAAVNHFCFPFSQGTWCRVNLLKGSRIIIDGLNSAQNKRRFFHQVSLLSSSLSIGNPSPNWFDNPCCSPAQQASWGSILATSLISPQCCIILSHRPWKN